MKRAKAQATAKPAPSVESSIRHRIVDAAVGAFMENGYAGTSTLEIATRAKVSKRDLYANFDGKQAMLVACITSRAARMRLPPNLPVPRSRDMLAATLVGFGATILREVSHPAVMAMFRLAIAEAERAPEVAEVLDASRVAGREALAALLAQAQSTGLLAGGDPHRMMDAFFALLWGDLLVRLLLRVADAPKPAEIDRRARAATAAFLTLYASA